MKITIKRLAENAPLPTKGSSQAAGFDLRANLDGNSVIIDPHKTIKIGTGVAMAIPAGHMGLIFARSGLATKEGLRPSNCVGLVDSDYRGEIIVALHNDTSESKMVSHGDRIAQLVILPYPEVEFEEGVLDETERGEGGFGSTGRN